MATNVYLQRIFNDNSCGKDPVVYYMNLPENSGIDTRQEKQCVALDKKSMVVSGTKSKLFQGYKIEGRDYFKDLAHMIKSDGIHINSKFLFVNAGEELFTKRAGTGPYVYAIKEKSKLKHSFNVDGLNDLNGEIVCNDDGSFTLNRQTISSALTKCLPLSAFISGGQAPPAPKPSSGSGTSSSRNDLPNSKPVSSSARPPSPPPPPKEPVSLTLAYYFDGSFCKGSPDMYGIKTIPMGHDKSRNNKCNEVDQSEEGPSYYLNIKPSTSSQSSTMLQLEILDDVDSKSKDSFLVFEEGLGWYGVKDGKNITEVMASKLSKSLKVKDVDSLIGQTITCNSQGSFKIGNTIYAKTSSQYCFNVEDLRKGLGSLIVIIVVIACFCVIAGAILAFLKKRRMFFFKQTTTWR